MPGTAVTRPSAEGEIFAPPRLLHVDDRGAVDLAKSYQPIGRQPERCHRNFSVGGDILRHITRAEATIQRAEQTFADPALAGKERVTDTAIGAERA